jgi:diaminohydroxyphosphoribosylaminopyrimidine deaminase/5-amino-6-(5-phosphoribosylamino)uracil reductase
MNVEAAMARCLTLARRGWGLVPPNPMVGAVLLRDGKVVAEGFHAEFGGPHAEVMALGAAREAARGSTCVVNLEPCNHHGKTPPCAEALIEAGVARVVAAVPDPHRTAKGGAVRLAEAGVAVELGVLLEEAAALNAVFLWNQVRSDRPFVALKLATSLDGFLADSGGRSKWISGAPAREFAHWLRAGFEAIAVGRNTAELDDPELTVRGSITPRIPPVRVVISRTGELRRDLRLVRTAMQHPTVLVTRPDRRQAASQRLAASGVSVLGAADVAQTMHELTQRGMHSVLVEGGGALATALLEADLVDRIYWIQAPIWLGAGVAAFGPRSPVALEAAGRWVVTERRALGEDTLLVVDRRLCLPAS